MTPVTDALVFISTLRFFPFPSPNTPFSLNHSRCLLQKLPKSAVQGNQPRAAGREQNPGGVADRWQLQGKQQQGIKSRNTQELCFRESVSLDDSKGHFNPTQPAVLQSRAEFSAGRHHCSKCVTCALQDSWPPRWTPFPRWSCHPPVSLCRKWCFICCSREQWVSKSEAQHGFECSSPMTFPN